LGNRRRVQDGKTLRAKVLGGSQKIFLRCSTAL
jgi:hypothetical protein